MSIEKLIEEIKLDEGFRAIEYTCTKGFKTIGYGTRLPLYDSEKLLCVNPALITKQEAEELLVTRLGIMIIDLENREPFARELPNEAQEIIANMIYQMGVGGVLKFRNMWKALKALDYKKASVEMLDSAWAIQTPNRANKLAKMMQEIL